MTMAIVIICWKSFESINKKASPWVSHVCEGSREGYAVLRVEVCVGYWILCQILSLQCVLCHVCLLCFPFCFLFL